MAVEGRGIQSIEVGGRILNALIELGRPTMLRDLASKADMTAAQAHSYLVSYRKMGLVEQETTSGRYLLGPMALQLGLVRMRALDPLRIASDVASGLSEETGFMVTVTVWGAHGPTIVQVHEAAYPVHVNLRVGALYTVRGTATGRLFSAFFPFEVVRPLLNKALRLEQKANGHADKKIPASWIEDFAEIRRQGYAVTAGIPVPGVNAVSVPVFDQSQKMQFGMTVIGPAAELSVNSGNRKLLGIVGEIQKLSRHLGYMPELEASDISIPVKEPRQSGKRLKPEKITKAGSGNSPV
ncbi:IclR family transcriptional regulator [Tardiphaga sp. vice304]|uniref:IclR family transcriptional regulator n=1 Tax=Tardiphaga sp. vice304 TaxID=2592817 RepID=UPI00116304B1|nr:IclR family transcriptional regulator [Tardiphaga sp. vice304]QDM27424.1 IclR family transcriptional regulator [Tardiphaga sp. vice304]